MMQTIQERRSIRKYQDRPVSRDLIEKVIQAGSLAPSAKNRQPWRFVIAQGESKQEMLAVMAQGLQREANAPLLPGSAPMIQGAVRTMRIMEQAPAVIFLLEPDGASLHDIPDAEGRVYERCDMQSIGACLENMSLAAASLGLGSLWICDVYFAYDELTAWLASEHELAAVMTLGYAAEQPLPRPRLPLDALIEWR
ncbi:MAG: nitroreductase family protein [Christensenellaceae bacterium]|nr:nitroreductase family protein [Christensenellaceae bacterium]